jgi:hypothetical protein
VNRWLFLRLLAVDSLFGCALAAAKLAYQRPIHPVGLIAIAAVLLLYTGGAAALAVQALKPIRSRRALDDVGELCEALPAAAMLGTVGGFLIALSAASGDIQHRAAGASTALVSTFVGIAAMLVLRLQLRLLERDGT